MDGMRGVVRIITQGMCLGMLKIVFNNVDTFVRTQNLTAMPGLADPLAQIESNVDIIWFVFFAGVTILVMQMYYRAVQNRKYEGVYSETGWADGYNQQ